MFKGLPCELSSRVQGTPLRPKQQRWCAPLQNCCSDRLTNISLIKCPGLSRIINPTTIPAKIDTTVSCIARIRLTCR